MIKSCMYNVESDMEQKCINLSFLFIHSFFHYFIWRDVFFYISVLYCILEVTSASIYI